VTEISSIPRPAFLRVVGRALARPVNLLVGGAAAVVAVTADSWTAAAVGGAAYLGLAAWNVASPRFWMKALSDPGGAFSGEDVEMPKPRKLADPALRAYARSMGQSRKELVRLVAGGSSVTPELVSIAVPLRDLDARAARLLRMGDGIYRYLEGVDPGGLRREATRLRANAGDSRDAAAREQYAASAAAREEQLRTVEDLRAALDRVRASVARIVATLEGLVAKFVRVRALDAEAMHALSGDVDHELQRVSMEIGALEETIRHVGGAKVAAR
jgi:hypothetical protein